MQKTSGSKNREVGVRFSHKSIGDGRKDNIPDCSRAGDEDRYIVVLVDVAAAGVVVVVLLRSPDPNCKCIGEFGGRRCSSSEAFPARTFASIMGRPIIEGLDSASLELNYLLYGKPSVLC
jgi:hypothetical protein